MQTKLKFHLKAFVVLMVAAIVCVSTATLEAPYHQDLAVMLVITGFILLGLSFFALEATE